MQTKTAKLAKLVKMKAIIPVPDFQNAVSGVLLVNVIDSTIRQWHVSNGAYFKMKTCHCLIMASTYKTKRTAFWKSGTGIIVFFLTSLVNFAVFVCTVIPF